MKRLVIGTTAVLGVAALAAFGVQAQGGGGPDGPFRDGRGDRFPMSSADREAFAEARLAALRAGLRLTPDQEKLWPPVEEALRGLAKQRQEARAARQERWASFRDGKEADIPGQLRFMADRRAASADALRRLADATGPLYGSLDDGQKRRLRILARFMGPGHGMMRRFGPGGRGGGYGDEGGWRRGGPDGDEMGFPGHGGPRGGPRP